MSVNELSTKPDMRVYDEISMSCMRICILYIYVYVYMYMNKYIYVLYVHRI